LAGKDCLLFSVSATNVRDAVSRCHEALSRFCPDACPDCAEEEGKLASSFVRGEVKRGGKYAGRLRSPSIAYEKGQTVAFLEQKDAHAQNGKDLSPPSTMLRLRLRQAARLLKFTPHR
jgi:hypothetical protein